MIRHVRIGADKVRWSLTFQQIVRTDLQHNNLTAKSALRFHISPFVPWIPRTSGCIQNFDWLLESLSETILNEFRVDLLLVQQSSSKSN